MNINALPSSRTLNSILFSKYNAIIHKIKAIIEYFKRKNLRDNLIVLKFCNVLDLKKKIDFHI